MVIHDANYLTNFLPKNCRGIDEALFAVSSELYDFKIIYAEVDTCLIRGDAGSLLILNSKESKKEQFEHLKIIFKGMFLEEISCLHSEEIHQ